MPAIGMLTPTLAAPEATSELLDVDADEGWLAVTVDVLTDVVVGPGL